MLPFHFLGLVLWLSLKFCMFLSYCEIAGSVVKDEQVGEALEESNSLCVSDL
jgi:hypothetical protein